MAGFSLSVKHMKIIMLSAVVLFLMGGRESIYSAFLDPGWGAGPTSLGGAYVSRNTGSTTMLWNPAATSQLRRSEVSFSYCRPYYGLDLYSGGSTVDLSMNQFDMSQPLSSFGSIGFAYTSINVTSLYNESSYILNFSFLGSKLKKFFADMNSSNSNIIGGFKRNTVGRPSTISYIGFNLKVLNQSYKLDEYSEVDPVFRNSSSSFALSLDFGMLFRYSSLGIAFAFKDVNQPDIGIKAEDRVPMESRVGISYYSTKLVPSLDLSIRDKLYNAHFGCEYLLNSFSLRSGVNMDEVSAGFGFTTSFLRLDYGFIWPFVIKESYGTHRLTLGFKWGKHHDRPEPAKILKIKKPKARNIKKYKPRKVKTPKIKKYKPRRN